MALIFGGSTDVLSSAHTSKYIAPILRWFWPNTTDATVNCVQIVVRKSGHLTEYALLALFLYRAVRMTKVHPPATWCRSCAQRALLLAVLYAASDEFHQSFVPSRGSSVHDVAVDAVGAGLGLLIVRRRLLLRSGRNLQPQG